MAESVSYDPGASLAPCGQESVRMTRLEHSDGYQLRECRWECGCGHSDEEWPDGREESHSFRCDGQEVRDEFGRQPRGAGMELNR